MSNKRILAIYSYVDLLVDTIKELRSKGFEDIRAFSPVPNHEIEDALDQGFEPSKVKYFTFCGAILGACVGAAFTILTSMDWPIVTSAKPIVSIPPYMIIIFECMILIGGLSTFLGLIINSRLRKNVDPIDYDERFSNDKFGILVSCEDGQFEEVEYILRNFGSEELKLNGEVLEEKIPEPEPVEPVQEEKPAEPVQEEKPAEPVQEEKPAEPVQEEKPAEEKESDS